MRGAMDADEEVMRNPIRGIFAGCCASTTVQDVKRHAHSETSKVPPLLDLLFENPKSKIQNRIT
jgi:hypothetical protein